MKQSQIQILISGVFCNAMLECKQAEAHWTLLLSVALLSAGYMIASTISSINESKQ